MSDRFRLNEPHVAAERFDDELMLVNLERGSYYSLAGTGAAIFRLLELGCTAREVVGLLEDRFGAADVGGAVERFVERLVAEQIVVATTDGHAGSSANGDEARGIAASLVGPFEEPQLEGYTDMQELLQIDPIHEVNDQYGWPKTKPD